MKWTVLIDEVLPDDGARVGGKAMALARLAREGMAVPHTVCVPTGVYRYFIESTGLEERVLTELNRKPFKEMRWEEVWDCALRIRNMFLTMELPVDAADALSVAIADAFGEHPVAVRSSAPGEDGTQASFAGLHESYLNVRGPVEILSHIRMVWASLWSDAALLYRQELGLDVRKSTMAVVIQELKAGSRSGVFFGVNPNDHEQSVLEAVYGLNQGLVDGEIAPDRWIIERATGRIIDYTAPERQEQLVPGIFGVVTEPLPFSLAKHPPLSPDEVARVVSAGRQAETLFGSPQDVEWTFTEKGIIVLQSRPITSGDGTALGDKRAWYLSLHRSFENLKVLEAKITGRLIPAMIEAAGEMAATELTALTNAELVAEIEHRRRINDHWVQVYWSDFIPFAHGMRLFGQFYNDTIQPEDPYQFMRLLEKSDLVSVKRNRMLAKMAQMVREDKLLRKRLRDGEVPVSGHDFEHLLVSFIDQFGDLTCPVTGGTQCRQGSDAVIRIILELSGNTNRPMGDTIGQDEQRLQEHFLSRFEGERREYALAILELGRNSYKLRDDDNIYLGRIEAQLYTALREAQMRLSVANEGQLSETKRHQLKTALDGFEVEAATAESGKKKSKPDSRLKARQVVGQPAGPGLASGTARVIRQHDELLDFKRDEILVCDAVDPNMTFIVPLVAAVVERRGGMLIHGAIIAREYGIPCVTGVPDATDLIHTGDYVTVDGFLGLVTLGTAEL